MLDIDILMHVWRNRVKQIDFVLKWLSRFWLHNVNILNSLHEIMRRREEPCPGSRELKRRALGGESMRRALKKGGPRMEWKGRKDDEGRQSWRIRKIPVGSEVTNIVAIDPKMVAKVAELGANLVAKNDANFALPPRFRPVLIESPL
ncbi:hypothetical protein TNCV_1606811 [Trichonephila clavipes]|nr:hypothetical protein TNCV_1606811 [Trichonephila clavipes]